MLAQQVLNTDKKSFVHRQKTVRLWSKIRRKTLRLHRLRRWSNGQQCTKRLAPLPRPVRGEYLNPPLQSMARLDRNSRNAYMLNDETCPRDSRIRNTVFLVQRFASSTASKPNISLWSNHKTHLRTNPMHH